MSSAISFGNASDALLELSSETFNCVNDHAKGMILQKGRRVVCSVLIYISPLLTFPAICFQLEDFHCEY